VPIAKILWARAQPAEPVERRGGTIRLPHTALADDGADRPLLTYCRRFRPVGETDSEIAFCGLMERTALLWEDHPPSPEARLQTVARYAAELRELGPANFLYSDGELLFAHGHRRTQADGQIAPRGLTVLTRRSATERDALPAAGVTLETQLGPQSLTLFASVALTDEDWRPLHEGEIVMVRNGERL